MSKGILVFASDNGYNTYGLQAEDVAKRARHFLDLPVMLVTDDDTVFDSTVFDHVIRLAPMQSTSRPNKDGELVPFKNNWRTQAYALSIYDQTLVLDTDVVICNDDYLQCFEQPHDFLIYKDAVCLDETEPTPTTVSDAGPAFYWATAFYFTKTQRVKDFSELLLYIQSHWIHYKAMYQIPGRMFRNDHVFSVGLNLFSDFAKPMPGKLFYTNRQSELKILTARQAIIGDLIISDTNIHIMDKDGLDKCLGAI
jgi:hypothetical protein